jgi:hypothetical protein
MLSLCSGVAKNDSARTEVDFPLGVFRKFSLSFSLLVDAPRRLYLLGVAEVAPCLAALVFELAFSMLLGLSYSSPVPTPLFSYEVCDIGSRTAEPAPSLGLLAPAKVSLFWVLLLCYYEPG